MKSAFFKPITFGMVMAAVGVVYASAFTASPSTAQTARAQPTISTDQLPRDTVVVPRHVYDNRKNTTGFRVPRGYKAVWSDGRLNPRRAEQTLRPSRVIYGARAPQGFRDAWDDDRLNRNRSLRSATGDTLTARIWTDTTPRQLVKVPTGVPVAVVPRERRHLAFPYFGAQFPSQPGVETQGRVSSRAALFEQGDGPIGGSR